MWQIVRLSHYDFLILCILNSDFEFNLIWILNRR
jgi:hypothetical protein